MDEVFGLLVEVEFALADRAVVEGDGDLGDIVASASADQFEAYLIAYGVEIFTTIKCVAR